jgi:hypothetical protein
MSIDTSWQLQGLMAVDAIKERTMAGVCKCVGAMAVSFAVTMAICAVASAKSKMTYEQAFAKCKQEISANVDMSDRTATTARSTAGAACMKRYGYRLKKGTM